MRSSLLHRRHLSVRGVLAGRCATLLAALALSAGFAQPARADSSIAAATPVREPARWAVGVSLGDPTGLSIKRYLGGRNAFDITLGAVYGPGLRLGADYLWGLARLAESPDVTLDFYLGAGAFVGSLNGPCAGFGDWRRDCNGDAYAGVRMPVGLDLLFHRAPISLGLELAPGIAFAPGRAGFLVDAALLARILL